MGGIIVLKKTLGALRRSAGVLALPVLVATGCNEEVVLGPEYTSVTGVVSGVVDGVRPRTQRTSTSIEAGQRVTIAFSYVPIHAVPWSNGLNYDFPSSHRNQVNVTFDSCSVNLPLVQMFSQNDGSTFGDRFAVVGQDRTARLELITRDGIEPLTLIETDGVPVVVNTTAIESGYATLEFRDGPSQLDVLIALDGVPWWFTGTSVAQPPN